MARALVRLTDIGATHAAISTARVANIEVAHAQVQTTDIGATHAAILTA